LTGLDRYIPLVIFLMVETGLRIEELCTVKWEQVSLDKRRMEVLSRAGRKSMRPGQSSYRFGYACISKSSLPH
jgi:integrase